MTRKEEILRKAMNFYPDCPERGFGTGDYEYPEFHDDEREAFIEGAKWADKTMIEKAIQWLFENVYDYLNPEDQERVESFRKYLEE
jgi:hypothetical protein